MTDVTVTNISNVRHEGWKKDNKKHNVGIRTHFGGKKHGTQSEIEKEKNQSRQPLWLTACQGVFCERVENSSHPLFASLSLPHPSLATSTIMVLSSPPKRLAELPQQLPHSSLHCPSSSSFSPRVVLGLGGRPFAARWRLRNDAPLIFLFCNLHRRRMSCFTCVIFNSCPAPSFAPTAPHYSAAEAVFHYLFSLCPQIRYMTGWTQAQKRQ